MPTILIRNLLIAGVLVSSSVALGGLDPDEYSYGEIAYTGPGIPILFNAPGGDGTSFTEAMLLGGAEVDATLTLYVRDSGMNPVAGLPTEDMWLETTGGGLATCPNGTIADGPSDQNGETHWIAPLRAGGSSETFTQIILNGAALWGTEGFELYHNSADINGDLKVDLVDLGLFAMDFTTGYAFRSDFQPDGNLNVSDVGSLAAVYGSECP